MGDKTKNEINSNSLSSKTARGFDFNADYSPNSVALRTAAIYMVIGALWIILSDRVLSIFISSREEIIFVSTIKGWVYVLLTGWIIYLLVVKPLKKIKVSENRIKESYNELRAVNEELSASEEFGRTILDKMLNAYALHKIILDDSGQPCDYEYVDVNPSFEAFTGLKKVNVIGKRYKDLVTKNETEKTDWIGIYGSVAMTGMPVTLESYTEAFEKWVTVNAYSPKQGYFITVFNDISRIKKSETELKEKNEELTSLYEELTASEEELRQQFDELGTTYEKLNATQEELRKQLENQKSYQEKLHQNAYHDYLTGLPNRLSLYENLSKQLQQEPDERKALIFIDTDNFKFINDTMGHSFGDQLISHIGKRISSLFGHNYTVYRLGGDEFIVFCHGFSKTEEVRECTERIFQSFKSPFNIGNSTLYMSVSIGISTYPENGDNADELIQSADIAMYRAKTLGKSKYVFFCSEMQEKVKERMTIEKHLRSALQKNEFLLYYQPQLDIKTGKISGFEALLRWDNPVIGFISPLKFIGVAEETHLIISIGEWVLQNACCFLKKLHTRGYTKLTISVNVSILQLLQEDFIDNVLKILETTGTNPRHLELEITESILMESYQIIHDKLCRLREKGVKIALDDFGQGYSSLSYLKQLPINTLKIDKSFIDSINAESSSDSLTGSIVMIGRKMGLTILAEGVESQEQMDYLTKHRCHKIQGYLISRPIPENEAIELFERWN